MLHPFLQISFSRKTLERKYLLNEPLYVRKISSFRVFLFTSVSYNIVDEISNFRETSGGHR